MTYAHRFHVALQLGGALLLAALLAGALSEVAHAGWPEDGVPAGIGTASQFLPAACTDGLGGTFIVWRQWPANEPQQMRAQRLDANGTMLWLPAGVPVAPSSGQQHAPSLLPMGDGGAMVAWEDNRAGNYDIYVQRLDGAGAVAPGWPADGLRLAYHTNHEMDPVIVTDGAGGAFVAWHLVYSDTDWDIYAGHVSGNGVTDPLWPAAGRAVCYTSSWQDYPAVASDAAGGFFIAWRDSNLATGDTNLGATHLLASGQLAPGWTENGNVLCAASGRQGVPNLAADGSGGFVAAWRDFRSDPQGDIWAARMNAGGTDVWTHNGVPVCALASTQGDEWRVPVVSDGDGGAVLAWPDNRNPLTGPDVYAQRIDRYGFPCWAVNGVPLCVAPGSQGGLAMCPDASGGAFVVWCDQRSGKDIFGQHVVTDGRVAWPHSGLVFCSATGDQTWPVVCPDQNGGAIAVWQDHRGADADIYARKVDGLVNLVSDQAPPGWDAPVVPRSQNDATPDLAHVTDYLQGNSPNTWLNYYTNALGASHTPDFNLSCLLDGTLIFVTSFYDDFYWSGAPWLGVNIGGTSVPGGRHTLQVEADAMDQVPESNESDNGWLGQWVWSPLALVPATPVERSIPGPWGDLSYPNTDGLFYPRCDLLTAWVTSVAAREPGVDVDLMVYDDYASSTSGFSHMVGLSNGWGTSTDFVVGHWMSSPTVLYPGVYRYGGSGSGTYYAEATEAVGHQGGAPPIDWNGMPLLPGRLADVYELHMIAGTTYWVSVARDVGSSTLEMGLFASTPGGVYGRNQAIAISAPASAAVAQLTYTATASGWYPLVVYRTDGEAADTPLRYSLHWASHPLVDVPEEPAASYELSFAGAHPNPARGSTALSFTLSKPGPARLEIFDARGRLVRRLADEARDAGPQRVVWDGRTDAGALAPSGIHWVRLTAEGRSFVRKVALVR